MKIEILMFSFLISAILSVSFSSASVTCSPNSCVVGSCQCSVSDCSSGTFGVYSTSDCSGFPLSYAGYSGGAVTWSPSQAASYYVRAFCNSVNSACTSIQVSPTPPTSGTTIVPTTATTTSISPGALTFTVNFSTGWNLFSVPVSYVLSSNTDCSPASYMFGSANGSYYQTTYSNGGVGYWVLMNSVCHLTVTGNYLAIGDFQALSPGWNLIGTPTNAPVNIAFIKGNCNILSGPLWYEPSNSSYVTQTILQPGNGYWVKVSNSCNLAVVLPPQLPQ